MKLFERTQWPVGHGGFHTGRIISKGESTFRYFYDCGSHAKDKKASGLILDEFMTHKYQVGVISHLDHDHFAAVKHSKPTVLYLPYMTRTDQLLQLMVSAEGVESRIKAGAAIYSELNEIRGDTEIIMVSGGRLESGEGDGDSDIMRINRNPLDSECAYPVVSHKSVLNYKNSVSFKFFNHYAGELGQVLYGLLVAKLDNFVDAADDEYDDVQSLLLDIEQSPAEAISRNVRALKAVYAELVSTHPVAGVTPSNLSSLVLMTFCEEVRADSDVRCSPPLHARRWHQSGWMLTGDLELKDKVWEPFYEHYALDLENCVVFNLPHHASTIALNWKAMHLLSNEIIFLANVNKGDAKHPSPQLCKAMDEFSLRRRHSVNEKPASAFTFNVRIP
jgi:hypothetical protein